MARSIKQRSDDYERALSEPLIMSSSEIKTSGFGKMVRTIMLQPYPLALNIE